MKSKKELRKEILQLRDALSVELRKEKSHLIAEKVIAQSEFIEADKILLFASFKSEVETGEIFQTAREAGKEVYFPKVLGTEMEFYQVEKEEELIEGYRGIREPKVNSEKRFTPQANDKICVIMPGAVFDIEGNRIGYGGGYYDKYLGQMELADMHESCVGKKSISKIAIVFDCQLVEIGKISNDEYDIKPDYIVTEDCLIDVSQAKNNSKVL